MNILLLVILATAYVSGNDPPTYPPCTGLKHHFDGYTYNLDTVTGEKVWTHCSFPSPFGDHARCGRPVTEGRYFLCDPDNLLDEEQSNGIEDKLLRIQDRTSTVCTRTSGEKESFRVAVVLINRIRIPDLRGPNLCINECGQLQPEAGNDTADYPNNDEQDEILRVFTEGLRNLWNIGTCDNDVIVLFCKEFNKVFVSSGKKASHYLPASKVKKLRENFMNYVDQHGYHEGIDRGLQDFLSALKKALQGFTVAHLVVTINLVVVALLGTFIVFYIFIKDYHMNVWGEETFVVLWESLLKLVSGIWFIQLFITVIAMASHKGGGHGLLWALGTAIVAFVWCMVLYAVSKDVTSYAPAKW